MLVSNKIYGHSGIQTGENDNTNYKLSYDYHISTNSGGAT